MWRENSLNLLCFSHLFFIGEGKNWFANLTNKEVNAGNIGLMRPPTPRPGVYYVLEIF